MSGPFKSLRKRERVSGICAFSLDSAVRVALSFARTEKPR
jgi:hypothetical protein